MTRKAWRCVAIAVSLGQIGAGVACRAVAPDLENGRFGLATCVAVGGLGLIGQATSFLRPAAIVANYLMALVILPGFLAVTIDLIHAAPGPNPGVTSFLIAAAFVFGGAIGATALNRLSTRVNAGAAAEREMMEYNIQVEQVAAQTTAVVRCRANLRELATVVPQGCGEVWTYHRSTGLPQPGRNLALYLDDAINLECGVEVAQPFAGTERIICSRTPAGMVAWAAHFGPYERLGEAHAAIRQWCQAHGRALAGPNWELYGHWHDDSAQHRTDVFYLLQGG